MKNKVNALSYRYWLFVLLGLIIFFVATGSTLQATVKAIINNGDFELGNLDGWNTDGQVLVVTSGLDAITDNSLEKVAEGQYSAMIGDEIPWMNGSEPQQSSLQQVVQLPNTLASDAVLEFAYAVVANDPPDHPESEKPRFRVVVTDLTSNKILHDTEYLYTNQSSKDWYLGTGASNQIWNQPYYALSSDRWIFRPWKLVSIPLTGLSGHQLNIHFEVRDCNYGAHAIYGFLDGVRVGAHEDMKLPDLQGNPQPAVYIDAPVWAPLISWLEQLGLIWLCCLLPILLLLGLLLFWLLRSLMRKPTGDTGFVGGVIPSNNENNSSKPTGGIRKKLKDE